MDIFEEYFNKRVSLYEDCYDEYEYGIDELTGKEIRIRKFKSKLDFDLVEKYVNPHDIRYKNLLVGKYLKYYSNKHLKNLYYEILDIKIGGYNELPSFRMKILGKNFYSKNECMKIVAFPYFKIISKAELIEETNWIENKKTLYKNKNLYILKNEIGRIKIGISENVEQRVKALSNSAGMKIDILRVINFNGNLEWQLHKHFKEKRYIGEWFDLDSNDIELLLSNNLETIFSKKYKTNGTHRRI